MSIATLLLILKLITVAEAEVPAAIGLILQIKKALSTDPKVADALAKLNEESHTASQTALSKIAAWKKEHGQ